MRRFAHCLILLLAPCSAAWAGETFDKSQRGACVYSSESQRPASLPRTQPATSAAPATVARSPRPSVMESSGGGGGEDDLMQRMRAPRWHSFLPGMFR